MALAMTGFAFEDTFLKLAAKSLPIGQVLISFGVLGLIVFSGLATLVGEAPLPRAVMSRIVLVRTTFEVTGRLFFMLAIALTPLSTAAAILQSTPLVVIACAAVVFKERFGIRSWLAVAVGLCGVLLILRPGAEGFGLLSIFAVIATLAFAGRDLATRAAPLTLSMYQLGVLGFFSLVIAGLVALPFGAPLAVPDGRTALILLGAGSAGIVGYAALTVAMRTGEIGAVTPFRYTRLIFSMLAGVLVFHERPDLWTLVGALVIVASGLIALSLSPRRRAETTSFSPPD